MKKEVCDKEMDLVLKWASKLAREIDEFKQIEENFNENLLEMGIAPIGIVMTDKLTYEIKNNTINHIFNSERFLRKMVKKETTKVETKEAIQQALKQIGEIEHITKRKIKTVITIKKGEEGKVIVGLKIRFPIVKMKDLAEHLIAERVSALKMYTKNKERSVRLMELEMKSVFSPEAVREEMERIAITELRERRTELLKMEKIIEGEIQRNIVAAEEAFWFAKPGEKIKAFLESKGEEDGCFL